MRLLRRNQRASDALEASAAAAEAVERLAPDEDFPGSLLQLRAEIDRLTAANRAGRNPEIEHELLRLRHLAGVRMIDGSDGGVDFAPPDTSRLAPLGGAPGAVELPESDPGELTAGLIRAGLLRDGSIRVRGLVDRADALRLAEEIDRAFCSRERMNGGERPEPGYYDEFRAMSRFDPEFGRGWIALGGGLLAADSPSVFFQMNELFMRAGIRELVSAYLGEPALTSVQKTTLRRARPAVVKGAWHQDGYFMGPVRSLNLWVALSRCGDVAPGLDIVPRRIDEYLMTNTEEAPLDYTIAEHKVSAAAGENGIVRPIFEPGDAIFFDEMCVHSTASEPTMPNARYAIENWFFGASGFAGAYAPLAV